MDISKKPGKPPFKKGSFNKGPADKGKDGGSHRSPRGGRPERERYQGKHVSISLAKSPVIVAIDEKMTDKAIKTAESVSDFIGAVKLGLEFFTANGSFGVKRFSELGYPVFLDLKSHDIPNTVAQAVRATLFLRPRLLTIHLGGGGEMIKAAVAAANEARGEAPMILGVSVLTSLDNGDMPEIGVSGSAIDQVLRLAELGLKCGIGGLVCSGQEIEDIRRRFGKDLKLVVPGIRPAGLGLSDDQKRTLSPAEAMAKGADYLVIGRPITAAPDPKVVARIIAQQIKA